MPLQQLDSITTTCSVWGGLWRLSRNYNSCRMWLPIWLQKLLSLIHPGHCSGSYTGCQFISGLVWTFKVHLQHLRGCLLPCSPAQPLRSSEWPFLYMLPLMGMKGMAARNGAFSVVAPWWWNSLPSELRTASSLETCWWDLKAFLCRMASNGECWLWLICHNQT